MDFSMTSRRRIFAAKISSMGLDLRLPILSDSQKKNNAPQNNPM